MIIIPISDMIAYRRGVASALPHGFQGSLLRMLFSDAEFVKLGCSSNQNCRENSGCG